MAGKQNSVDEEEIMTDADFEKAMQALVEEEGNEEVNNLLMAMSDNQIISWDEAERILGETSNEPVKSSLPQQTRPTEPDNDTDVDVCMQKLQNNDPKLVEINLNNMKRTPVPKIKRMIEAMQDNEHLEKLSLANMGLYDMDLQPLIDVLERNTTLRCLNLETNYLSGEFFARLFKAALTNQSLEEVKAVNQGMAFSTQYEREIIESITQNRGLTKVSINLRLPEGRFKVEQATIRNQEIRRILRRQMLAEQKEKEEPKPKAPAKKETPRTESPEKKPPLKKQPSGAAAELAKQQSPSKLAIAGVNTPRPSTSNEVPKPEAEKTAVRERARETEKASKKPYEAEKNAERLLLSEKAKQRTAGGRWPPAGEIDKPTTEETPKSQKTTMEEQPSKGEPPKGPNWRDRLAKKADQQEPPQQERKGSLALRDKFEQKGREVAKKPPPKEKEKLALGGTERLAAARGRFEKQKAAEGKSVEVDGGKEEAPRPKLKAKPKPVAAAAEAAAAENHEEKKADGPAGEKKPAPVVKKRVASSKKAAEEKDKDMEKPITTNEEEPSKPANAKPAGFTPSWRQRMNK